MTLRHLDHLKAQGFLSPYQHTALVEKVNATTTAPSGASSALQGSPPMTGQEVPSPSAALENQLARLRQSGLWKDFERTVILTQPILGCSYGLQDFALASKDFSPEICSEVSQALITFYFALREKADMKGLSRLWTGARGLYWMTRTGWRLSIGSPIEPILPGGTMRSRPLG